MSLPTSSLILPTRLFICSTLQHLHVLVVKPLPHWCATQLYLYKTVYSTWQRTQASVVTFVVITAVLLEGLISGMWLCVAGEYLPIFRRILLPLPSGSSRIVIFGLLISKDEGTTILRNDVNYPPKISALHTRQPEPRISVHYTDFSVTVVHGNDRFLGCDHVHNMDVHFLWQNAVS